MHGLEIGSKGQVAFASRQEPAWHNLGTVFEGTLTTDEMLSLAHLKGWNVRLESVKDVVGMLSDSYNFVTEPYMVVRDNPFNDGQNDVLATVGERYKVVQNEELFSFGDGVLAGGGTWETAGSIRDGRVVFGSLSIGKEVRIGDDDVTNMYLLVNTSHDGSVAVQASVTPVRVVCQNTLNFALRNGVKQQFKMRHTQTIEGRMAQAREALNISFAYADEFEREMSQLFQVQCTKDKFDELVQTLYPKPEKDVKGSMVKWESKRDLLMGIFTDTGDGPKTTQSLQGTMYGALNALTERIDWYRMPRGGNVDNLFIAASGFDPVVNAEKNRIRKAVLALAS
jgi:phage/plasmid-like protein (TIGR03299 family)